jgi:heme-degrading monooxygenase HmoA
MAVGLRIKFAEGTQEEYEAVNAQMGVEENLPDGLIFHSAGPIEGGWGVIDFWESREHFDRFQESRLGPAIQELGDRAPQGPPDIKEFPVHNLIKG